MFIFEAIHKFEGEEKNVAFPLILINGLHLLI